MRFEPFVTHFVSTGRMIVDLELGLVFSSRSNTPCKPLGAITRKGYLRICFNIDGKQSHAFVHRVVWIAASGCDIPAGMQIDHLNGLKTDNRISNLQCVTGDENMKRAARNGLMNGGRTDAPRDQVSGQFVGKTSAV